MGSTQSFLDKDVLLVILKDSIDEIKSLLQKLNNNIEIRILAICKGLQKGDEAFALNQVFQKC